VATLDGRVAEAAKEAMTELGLAENKDGEIVPTGTASGTPDPEAGKAGEPSPPGSTGGKGEVEPGTTGDGEPVPETMFGVDLSALPEPEREVFIREWTEQNKHINKLQREKAELAKAGEKAPEPKSAEPELPETISDEVLAQALHLDLEDADDARLAERLIPLARMNLEMKQQLEATTSTVNIDAEARFWNGELDKLEKRFGDLPVTRTELLEEAAERGIADPEAAYWAAVGPIRVSVSEALNKQLQAARKTGKQQAATPRPKSSVPTQAKALESKTTKAAVLEAAKLAAEELGFDWEDARRAANRL